MVWQHVPYTVSTTLLNTEINKYENSHTEGEKCSGRIISEDHQHNYWLSQVFKLCVTRGGASRPCSLGTRSDSAPCGNDAVELSMTEHALHAQVGRSCWNSMCTVAIINFIYWHFLGKSITYWSTFPPNWYASLLDTCKKYVEELLQSSLQIFFFCSDQHRLCTHSFFGGCLAIIITVWTCFKSCIT